MLGKNTKLQKEKKNYKQIRGHRTLLIFLFAIKI